MNRNFYYTLLGLAGIIIIWYSVYINLISSEYTYEAHPSSNGVRLYVFIRILVGIVYTLSIILIIKKKIFSRNPLIFVFVVGLVTRLILVPSEPILEDDYNRYLWDGAVTANGYNPYEYAPKKFITSDSANINELHRLYTLADSAGIIMERINHPHIRTIYPPVAQIFFAASYLLKPWDISIWKLILLVVDISVFILLIIVLKRLGKPLILSAIYWCNPILLHEVFNAGHMDLLMYPLLVGSILLYVNKNYIWSGSLIAIAVGVKVWPIIFIPFIFKKLWCKKDRLTLAITIIGIILCLQFLPILLTKIDDSLGFITYSKNWTNNESVFQIVNLIIKQFISTFDINYHCSLCVARWITVLFFCGIVLYYLAKTNEVKYRFVSVTFILVSIMFLISPTQFPWYYTWVLPFLVFNPRLSFIAYSIFLPLYQLKYSMPFMVWIEHIPIILLFISELYSKKIRNYLSVAEEKS